MKKRYDGLIDLLKNDTEAGRFYADLPDYVQDMICQRSGSVHSISELRSYADNLLSGDK